MSTLLSSACPTCGSVLQVDTHSQMNAGGQYPAGVKLTRAKCANESCGRYARLLTEYVGAEAVVRQKEAMREVLFRG